MRQINKRANRIPCDRTRTGFKGGERPQDKNFPPQQGVRTSSMSRDINLSLPWHLASPKVLSSSTCLIVQSILAKTRMNASLPSFQRQSNVVVMAQPPIKRLMTTKPQTLKHLASIQIATDQSILSTVQYWATLPTTAPLTVLMIARKFLQKPSMTRLAPASRSHNWRNRHSSEIESPQSTSSFKHHRMGMPLQHQGLGYTPTCRSRIEEEQRDESRSLKHI